MQSALESTTSLPSSRTQSKRKAEEMLDLSNDNSQEIPGDSSDQEESDDPLSSPDKRQKVMKIVSVSAQIQPVWIARTNSIVVYQ